MLKSLNGYSLRIFLYNINILATHSFKKLIAFLYDIIVKFLFHNMLYSLIPNGAPSAKMYFSNKERDERANCSDVANVINTSSK